MFRGYLNSTLTASKEMCQNVPSTRLSGKLRNVGKSSHFQGPIRFSGNGKQQRTLSQPEQRVIDRAAYDFARCRGERGIGFKPSASKI